MYIVIKSDLKQGIRRTVLYEIEEVAGHEYGKLSSRTGLLRVVWIYTVFAAHRTLPVLFLSYPVTWIVTETVHFICYLYVKKRVTARGIA